MIFKCFRNAAGPALMVCVMALVSCQEADQAGNAAKDMEVTGRAEVTPDAEHRLQASIKWPLKVRCTCEDLVVRQEIRGYMKFYSTVEDPEPAEITARDIVNRQIGFATEPTEEIERFRKTLEEEDASRTEFIPDIGRWGTSQYPPELMLDCKPGEEAGLVTLKLHDQPGSTARVGNFYEKLELRLNFRVTVYCRDKRLGQYSWHFSYDLQRDKSPVLDVDLDH